MTNAIEQAKREMYANLKRTNEFISPHSIVGVWMEKFESDLETYLELLRIDHEALHETARKRFEDLQVAEATNEDLSKKIQYWRDLNSKQCETIIADGELIADLNNRIAKMTEDRDTLRNKVQAANHVLKAPQSLGATQVSNSGENVSSATLGGKTAAIQVAVVSIRKISDAWAMTGRRAKKSMLKISGILARPEVYAALEEIEKSDSYAAWFINNDKCQHSFFAIGDEPAKCTYCCEVKP